MDMLRRGLAGLPTPKNDYEIVVPEDELGMDTGVQGGHGVVEDQADVDDRAQVSHDWSTPCCHRTSLFVQNIFVHLCRCSTS